MAVLDLCSKITITQANKKTIMWMYSNKVNFLVLANTLYLKNYTFNQELELQLCTSGGYVSSYLDKRSPDSAIRVINLKFRCFHNIFYCKNFHKSY